MAPAWTGNEERPGAEREKEMTKHMTGKTVENEIIQARAGGLSILIADDDPRVCRALRSVIELDPELTVSAAVTSTECVRQSEQALKPSIFLLDLVLPRVEDGLRLVHELVQRGQTVVAMSLRSGLRTEALDAGATAFVEKDGSVESL